MNNNFEKNLIYLRNKAKITQVDLAKKIGVSPQTVWRWEHGEREPSIEIIKKLCKVLNCTEVELLGSSEEQTQDWNIEIKISKGNEVKTAMDLTSTATAAVLDLGDIAMGITLKAGYEIWEDDSKFEKLIAQLRRKRKVGLKVHKEDVDEVNQ